MENYIYNYKTNRGKAMTIVHKLNPYKNITSREKKPVQNSLECKRMNKIKQTIVSAVQTSFIPVL